jgi:hypothetical protein
VRIARSGWRGISVILGVPAFVLLTVQNPLNQAAMLRARKRANECA